MFPWRNLKGRKISQIVNDHLHKSRKRRDGSSLVVETGFPTSLVDLVMKNREKLKKSSKKKKAQPPPDDSGDPPPREVSPPVQSAAVSEVLDVSGESDGNSNSNSSCKFLVAFKIFLVVFFVLGTDRLTIGITISVLLLFLVDYSESSALRMLVYSKGLFLRLVLRRTVGSDQNEGVLIQDKEDTGLILASATTGEIQSLEEDAEAQVGYREEDAKLKKTSKGGKYKSKLKHFFIKRFRARKEKDPQRIEKLKQSENSRESQALPSNEAAMPDAACESLEPANETQQGSSVEASGAWIFFALLLVALVGLAGGRPFSILLTVFFSFLLDFLVNRWGS